PDKTRIIPPRKPAESGSDVRSSGAGVAPPPRPGPEREFRSDGAGTAGATAAAQSASRADPFAGAQARHAWLGWLLARVRNILFKPKDEWPAIDAEAETVSGLYKRYIIPLQAAAAVAGWLGSMFILARIGFGTALFGGLASSIVGFVLALVLVAPLMILFALYGLYLLYLGLPPLMKCPREKAPVYTLVIVVIAIVLSVVIAMITGGMAALVGIGGSGMASLDKSDTAGAVLGGLTGSKDAAEATKRLEAMTKKMEEANKKMEAAEKSGDSAAAAAAATEALGAALSGGRKVEPVDFRELKALLPENVGGMKRTEARGEKSGMGGLMVATAEASYGGDGERSVELKLVDMGGAGLGMMGLAAWAMVEVDRETESGRERTGKLGGRPFHEKYDEKARSGEFALVVGQRFLVEASGDGVDLQTLKNAVAAVDLAKLEAMKDVGVTK
ncbi:MAG: hypothetical protein H6R11_2348, partial [Proteobacteria bacterium]|nr:hypothetical protein [Pseudomonadota bacterium]